ncbi:hypothetical protein [Pectobacterium versatile]|nr:hypothetical protein [Pectobacterium versatile]
MIKAPRHPLSSFRFTMTRQKAPLSGAYTPISNTVFYGAAPVSES